MSAGTVGRYAVGHAVSLGADRLGVVWDFEK